MVVVKSPNRFGSLRWPKGWLCLLCGCLLTVQAQAADTSFTNLLAQGATAGTNGDILAAVKIYSAAEQLEANNAADFCLLTKRFCDLMHITSSSDLQKTLAAKALACAKKAVQADPQSATAHLCVVVGCAKNFPFVDTRTKVVFSRLIKSESERAIALDPKQDVAYYMLGRWNFGVANMNFLERGFVKLVYGGLPPASNGEAIKDLKQAIVLAPDRIIHHAELAKVYAATGQKNLARQQLEICAKLKPLDDDDADAQSEAAKTLAAMKT